MKVFFKKKIISLIILLLLIILLPLTLGIIIKIYVNFSFAKVYKNDYSIDIIQPQKIKTIYSEGIRDPVILNKLIYDEKDFFKTLNYDYVLQMDKNKVEKLINDKFIVFHSSLNAEKLNNVINSII